MLLQLSFASRNGAVARLPVRPDLAARLSLSGLARRRGGSSLERRAFRRHQGLRCAPVATASRNGSVPPPRAAAAAEAAPAPSSSSDEGPRIVWSATKGSPRATRLEVFVQLRKLYRNLLRAEAVLEAPSPIYQPVPKPEPDESGEVDPVVAARYVDEEQARLNEAVEMVADMELSAEQLKIGMRSLRCSPISFGTVLETGGVPTEEVEGLVEDRIRAVYNELVARAAKEVEFLPFPTEAAAHAALDARNARYRVHLSWFPPTDTQDQDGFEAPEKPGLGERLGKAERVAEEFIGKKLSAVKKASPQGVLKGLRSGMASARDLWVRLNGGRGTRGGAEEAMPDGMPAMASGEAGRGEHVAALNLSIDALEKKLQEASKARETKLRKAGIQGRARMAGEIREMDNVVAGLSRELAVRTLQLEMEYIYGGLEEEALDVVGESKAGFQQAISRRGSSDELMLLVAEFAQLDEQLSAAAALAEAGEALFIDDEELARLATDIPDMRTRLGISETQVFGGTGLGWVKVQLQFKEGVAKVVEGYHFGTRGIRLLVSDTGSAGRLFWRALMGSTLKPREVQALRRTFKDLLTFIPFTIILIAPLTPVGHVLIFGFIQRYFPNFFPSQFSTKRQELMMKYEDLKQQLSEAQAQAEIENDEMEFQRAAAAATAAAAAALARKQGAAAPAPGGVAHAAAADGAPPAAEAAAGGTPPGSKKQQAAGAAGKPPSAPAAAVAAAGGAAAYDTDAEGPAARAVRDLQQKLAEAADDSYTTDAD